MNVVHSFRHLLDRHIVARDRKRNFQILERMTDRELNDIGLPREYLYADSANQRRHATVNKQPKTAAPVQENAA